MVFAYLIAIVLVVLSWWYVWVSLIRPELKDMRLIQQNVKEANERTERNERDERDERNERDERDEQNERDQRDQRDQRDERVNDRSS
jgi:flagellar biosynthesis/type III secretory pathway M-ring protein FliF/YscJ